MITQQCFTFRVRKSAKRKRPREKRDWIQDCKVRRAGDLDPTPSPLVLSKVTTVHTLNCVLYFYATGTIKYSAASMNNVNKMSGQLFNGGV